MGIEGVGPVKAGEEFPDITRGEDAPLREEDVQLSDRLDDRVSEGDGLADGQGAGEAGGAGE